MRAMIKGLLRPAQSKTPPKIKSFGFSQSLYARQSPPARQLYSGPVNIFNPSTFSQGRNRAPAGTKDLRECRFRADFRQLPGDTAMPAPVMQMLESRMFLSASPVNTNPTIIADRKQLQADEATLRADAKAGDTTLRADRKAINDELAKLRASDANLSAELKPFTDKLSADRKAGAATLRADAKAIFDAGKADRALLQADYQKLHTDLAHKAAQSVIDADKAKIKTDQAKLAADIKPAQDKLKADQTALKNTLKADEKAIQDKLVSLDSKLGPLYAKLASDQSALNTKLAADRAKVKADQDKLKADLAALKT